MAARRPAATVHKKELCVMHRRSKKEELVLAIPSKDFDGLWPPQVTWGSPDLAGAVAKLAEDRGVMVPRQFAESSLDFKQVIPFTVIVNQLSELFVTTRTKKSEEERLRERVSLVIGGHVTSEDLKAELGDASAMVGRGRLRELFEEVQLEYDNPEDVTLLGAISDLHFEVSRFHVGVAYLMRVVGSVTVKETDKMTGKFMSMEQARTIDERMENWSEIVLHHLLLAGEIPAATPRSTL